MRDVFEGTSSDGPPVIVAFAGHNRPEDLGAEAEAAAGVAAAFDLLARTVGRYPVLLTGLAEGADRIAAAAWRERGLGHVHAVHPYLDTPAGAESGLSHADTWLDGRALEADGRNPHLAQARWLISAADLLVAVWTGAGGRGAGGTADAVRLALEHNLPVLWVKPGVSEPLRLIRPEDLDEDFGLLELVEQLEANTSSVACVATPELLAPLLFPEPPPEHATAARAAGPAERLLERTLWRSYALFVRLIGAGGAAPTPTSPAPPDLLEQSGFVGLTKAYQAADAEAGRLAGAHRSQQVLLVLAAIGAAVVGSIPAVWPAVKIYAVICELALASLALAISLGAARTERHEQWSRARRLAEQLRLERAAWVLGLSTEGHRLAGLGATPFEARCARRRAGVPEGRYDLDRLRRWGAWALQELIVGQARYHRERGQLNHRVAHRIHSFETGSFAVFLVALGGFVLAYAASKVWGFELPHWAAGAVVMTSIVIPALGAACIALEAGLAFGDQSRRNRDMAAALDALAATLGENPGLDRIQRAAKAALRLQVVQEERWTDESARRQLVRAG